MTGPGMTDPAARVPDFLILGAMKSGTTTLYDLIKASADVDLPDTKEPGILTTNPDADAVRRAYARHFAGIAPGKVTGEATTHYTMRPLFDDVSALARDVAGPDLKLIAVLREPVARIESHLRHDFQIGRIDADGAARAIAEDPRYFATGQYHWQLAPWIAAFGRQNLMLIDFADLTSDPGGVMMALCPFLGIEAPKADLGGVHSNDSGALRSIHSRRLSRFVREGAYRRFIRPFVPQAVKRGAFRLLSRRRTGTSGQMLTDAQRAELHARYAPENEKLAAATGFDISGWTAPPALRDAS